MIYNNKKCARASIQKVWLVLLLGKRKKATRGKLCKGQPKMPFLSCIRGYQEDVLSHQFKSEKNRVVAVDLQDFKATRERKGAAAAASTTVSSCL